MIVDSGKYFLYEHIRLDTNETFYIGIGKVFKNAKLYKRKYKRAFEKGEKRNNIWSNITKKVIYKVNIILESDSVDFIKQKEIEFIKLLGRIDLGTGLLCNLTDGGDGCNNFKPTSLQIQKMIDFQSKNSKSVLCLNLDGSIHKEFETLTKAAKFVNDSTSNISQICKDYSTCVKSINKKRKGFIFCYKKDYKKHIYYNTTKKISKQCIESNYKPVYQYDLHGNFIKKWDTGIFADEFFGVKKGHITNIAGRNLRKDVFQTVKGFLFLKEEVNLIKVNGLKYSKLYFTKTNKNK